MYHNNDVLIKIHPKQWLMSHKRIMTDIKALSGTWQYGRQKKKKRQNRMRQTAVLFFKCSRQTLLSLLLSG